MAQAKLAVIGCGSWGCTIAWLLNSYGHEVRLWGHAEEALEQLRAEGHPPGVPELRLPDIPMSTSYEEVTRGMEAAVLVVRSQSMVDVAVALGKLTSPPPIVIIASKGIDLGTLRPLSDVVEEHLPQSDVVAVSGPCIAREVARGIPTSVVAACPNQEVARKAQEWFAGPTFRAYWHHDILGVEYGGALKNVIAIAAGVSDGLGFGANSKSALLTRGLAEMRRFAAAMGADDITITGLAGLGDLCVTCFSPYSRNRRFGEALGSGKTADEAIESIGEVVEGVATAEAVVRLAQQKQIEVPVAVAVTKIINGEWSPKEAVTQLMTRELKAEF